MLCCLDEEMISLQNIRCPLYRTLSLPFDSLVVKHNSNTVLTNVPDRKDQLYNATENVNELAGDDQFSNSLQFPMRYED